MPHVDCLFNRFNFSHVTLFLRETNERSCLFGNMKPTGFRNGLVRWTGFGEAPFLHHPQGPTLPTPPEMNTGIRQDGLPIGANPTRTVVSSSQVHGTRPNRKLSRPEHRSR